MSDIQSVTIRCKLLTDTAKLPEKAYVTDAGLDLFADEDAIIDPNGSCKVCTGLSLAIPNGWCGIIWDRSGVSTNARCEVVAGVIDSQYRGEIKVAFENNNIDKPVTFKKGDKIAQMLVVPVPLIIIEPSDELDDTARGSGGFGSTGI